MRLPQNPIQGFLLGMAMGAVIGTPIAYALWKAEQPLQGSRHYRLMASPTFTQQQQKEIRGAAHKWEQAVGNKALTISVQVGACPVERGIVDGCLIPATQLIDCRPANAQAVGCASSNNGWAYTKLEIDVACGDIHTFSHITQHEIGHLLGIFDNNIKGTVMYHAADCGEIQSAASQDVSQSDVEQYWRIHVLLDNPMERR